MLLKKIRSSVADFYSITAAHYINGGEAAIPELNTVHAVILHKGHKNDKSLDSSYRTISSCPFLAKCIDI